MKNRLAKFEEDLSHLKETPEIKTKLTNLEKQIKYLTENLLKEKNEIKAEKYSKTFQEKSISQFQPKSKQIPREIESKFDENTEINFLNILLINALSGLNVDRVRKRLAFWEI